jgi:hypothetical protein
LQYKSLPLDRVCMWSVCLRITGSNTFCFLFLFCLYLSCVPYVASFSGLSILYCLLVFSNVYFHVYIGKLNMLKENTYTQKYFYEVNICATKPLAWPIFYSGQGLGERTGSKKAYYSIHCYTGILHVSNNSLWFSSNVWSDNLRLFMFLMTLKIGHARGLVAQIFTYDA